MEAPAEAQQQAHVAAWCSVQLLTQERWRLCGWCVSVVSGADRRAEKRIRRLTPMSRVHGQGIGGAWSICSG